jgi:hypothetical protein
MSAAASHESKRVRRTCQRCQERKARFQYRGRVRADRDHTLCFECFRSERNRQRAQRLAGVSTPAPLSSSGIVPGSSPASLSDRQVAHRRAMLSYLALTRVSRPLSGTRGQRI